MNSDEYVRIGKELKRRNPGRWADNTDEEVGVVGVKYGLWPPKAEYGNPPSPDVFFPGFQAERTRKKTDYINAKQGLEVTLNDYTSGLEMQRRITEHRLENLPTRLAEMELQYDTLRVQQKATQKQIVFASANNMDVATANAWRLAQETNKLQIDTAKGMAGVEVEKHQAMTDIDLDKRRGEVELDVKAALTVALVDKHKILYVQDQVLKLLERAHEIGSSDKPKELKTAQLEIVNEVIVAFREQLRGYFQGDKQKGLPAGGTDTES